MSAKRRCPRILFASALAAAFCGEANAAPPDGLFGDWGGLLSTLSDDGVRVQAKYISDIAWNPSGGKSQGTRYADQWSLGADFDLGKLANIDNAMLHITLSNRDGRNLTQDTIGNEVQVQQIYGDGQNFRLDDFWYQQSFGGHLEIRLGRLHESDDFAYFSCDYQNLGFCSAPYAILADSGWNNPPLGVWGGRIKFTSGGWYAETGAYQVNPTYALSGSGFKLGTSGDTGTLFPAEVGWSGELGAQALPGGYKIGGYYDSSDAPDLYEDVHGQPAALTGLPARERDGRYGGYLMALQQVTSGSSGSGQGLSVFANATIADRNTALIRDSLTMGAWYKEPFASRPGDVIEFAAARFDFNTRLSDYQRLLNAEQAGPIGVQGAETDLIVQYNAKLSSWCTLGPNFQYVIHPNGLNSIANAFVVGLQTTIKF